MVEKGLNEQAVWIQLPLFFYKKLMHHLLMYYGTHPEVNAKYFWKQGIVLIFDNVRVLIKGLDRSETENEGKVLIGVEPNPKAIEIQKEVFSSMLKVLFATFSDIRLVKDSDKADYTLIRTGKDALFTDRTIGVGGLGASYSTKGYLFNEEINKYISNTQKPAPRWLKHLNISVNGEDFVNYLNLFREHEQKNPSVHCLDSNKIVKVNAFSAFLGNTGKKPLKVFFSYSHNDMDLMQRLHIHLAPLRRMDRIATWSDREILPGSDWDETIKENLRTADIVLLLISADFVASDYIWEKELKIIEERETKGEKVLVLPILLRPMDYSLLKFAEKQMLPKHEESGKLRPVSLWDDKELALSIIATKIKEAIDSF